MRAFFSPPTMNADRIRVQDGLASHTCAGSAAVGRQRIAGHQPGVCTSLAPGTACQPDVGVPVCRSAVQERRQPSSAGHRVMAKSGCASAKQCGSGGILAMAGSKPCGGTGCLESTTTLAIGALKPCGRAHQGAWMRTAPRGTRRRSRSANLFCRHCIQSPFCRVVPIAAHRVAWFSPPISSWRIP